MSRFVDFLTRRLRLPSLAMAGLLIVGLTAGGSAEAFHFPWDQGHDTTDWNDPNDPGPCEGPLCDPCSSTGSPVYLPTGHFVWTERDAKIPGRPGITVARTFNSHDPRDGMFGRGWTSSCDTGLFAATDSEAQSGGSSTFRTALVRADNGKRYAFREISAGVFEAPPGRSERITAAPNGALRVTANDGSSRLYASSGRILSESSPAGRMLDYEYDSNDRLIRITDQVGRFVRFEYTPQDRVSAVVDSADRRWTYGYDASGNLTSVTSPEGGTRRYEYRNYTPTGDGHTYTQLTRIIDEASVVLTTVTYTGDRVATYTVGENRFTYSHNASTRTVTKTDSLGSRWTYVYSPEGKILSTTDPISGTESSVYDANGKLVQHTDTLNQVWRWTYDTTGRVTSASNPMGETIRWEYEGDGANPVRAISPSGRITTAAYDSMGNLTSLTDAAGAQTRLTWDSGGNLAQIQSPMGQTTAITSDASGLPVRVVDPQGRSTQIAYDAVGIIASVTNAGGETIAMAMDSRRFPSGVSEPSGKSTVYLRDAAGRLASVTDPAGGITRFEYDSFGRVSARVTPDGRRYTYRYRADNLVREVVRPDGRTEQYTYDAAKRLVSATVAGETVSYVYNARHEMTSATNGTGTVSMAYDTVGRLIGETVNGQNLSYRYNAEGERVGSTRFGIETVYGRDGLGRITSIAAPEGTYALEYDAAGRRTRLTYPNGVVANYNYDSAGQLTRLNYSGQFARTYTYGYDAEGKLVDVAVDGVSTTYSYDPDGQLASAGGAAPALAFQYDAAGNHLGDGRSYDAGNRLVQDSRYTYTYDANGNLSGKVETATGALTVYRWNGWNQLVAVERYDDAGTGVPTRTTTFTYDPLRRRASRSVDGVTTRFVHEGTDVVATLDAGGNAIEQTTFGPGVDEPLGMDGAGGRRFLHADQLGSIVAVTGEAAELGRYGYGPFGETAGTLPPVENRYRYAAREYEADDLYYYRARYYDPQMRRFLSEDPIGLRGGDTNLYRYVGNNPVHMTDPSGEVVWFAVPVIWGAIEIGLAIYDAYDTADTLMDPCKSAGEKWLAGGLFVAGALLPGGGYTAADDIITSKPVKEGIYEFMDTSGKKYVGQSNDIPRRLQEHVDSGKLDPNANVDFTPMPGSDQTQREIAEHRRLQELVPEGMHPKDPNSGVSNRKWPIGPRRQDLLNGGGGG